jgi:GGDEF domain-containing protein
MCDENIEALLARIKELEERIDYLSKDPVYGIWTRAAFLQFCNVMPRGLRAVIFIDFDNIHGLNEQIGYTEVDRRIRATLTLDFRSSDLIARWYSGDEVVILIDGNLDIAEMKITELKENAHSNGLGFEYTLGLREVGKEPIEIVVNELSRKLIRKTAPRVKG